MATGAVRKLSAWVPVTVILPNGGEREIECLVDTGFSGHLSLPAELADALQLTPGLTGGAELADATEIQVQLYEGLIEWQGFEVEVDVIATGNRPLLGTGLLAGWELRAQFIEGGQVTVQAIEPVSDAT